MGETFTTPERLVPHLHVCEIPLHTLLSHSLDVHTIVEAWVFISSNFCLPNAACAFQTRRVPNCQGTFFRQKTLPPLVGVTLHFHLNPVARYPLTLLFVHLRLVFLDGRLSMSMAGPLLALEDEAPLVAVISCFTVTSSSPIRQKFSGGRPHSSDTACSWPDEEGCSCFLASTRACSLARYSLPSSLFSSSARILSLHVSE